MTGGRKTLRTQLPILMGLCVMGLLSACSSSSGSPDSYGASYGAMPLETSTPSYAMPAASSAPEDDTRRESCMRSCKQEATICGEAGATRMESYDAPKIIGAQAACDQSLRACLKKCK
jgi:hypothetical protein